MRTLNRYPDPPRPISGQRGEVPPPPYWSRYPQQPSEIRAELPSLQISGERVVTAAELDEEEGEAVSGWRVAVAILLGALAGIVFVVVAIVVGWAIIHAARFAWGWWVSL